MPHAEKRSLVITTSGQRPLHEVARDLKDAGLEVEQVLDAINVITGKGPAGIEGALRNTKGVVDVSEDFPVSIGPPGADVS